MQVWYSGFTKKFVKDNVNTYYHSLRMKPVYVPKTTDTVIERLIKIGDTDKVVSELDNREREGFLCLLDLMIKFRIFSKNPDDDENLLTNLRRNLPKPYPVIAYFIVTEDCNLRCEYCFIENKMNPTTVREKTMSQMTAKQGLDFFSRLIKRDMQRFDEEKTIVIYGGEPLMNFETVRYLLELIGQYKASKKLPLKTLVIINTNGTLITKDIADILAASGVSVSISLDGATARANACRKFVDGKPAFDSVLRGLNIAQEAGCACSLSTTMTEETIKDERQIVEMAERLHIQSMGLNTLMTDDYFRVSDDYYEKSADFLIRAFMLLREKGIYEDRIMRKLKTFVDAQRYSESSPYLYDCGAAGGNQVIIAPNGQVGLCQGYLNNREYFPTTVFCEDFIPEEDAVYLEWNRRTPITMTQCLHCEALGICGGGCPMNAKTWGSNHSIWDLDESFCVHAKKTLEWMIWDLYSKIDD